MKKDRCDVWFAPAHALVKKIKKVFHIMPAFDITLYLEILI